MRAGGACNCRGRAFPRRCVTQYRARIRRRLGRSGDLCFCATSTDHPASGSYCRTARRRFQRCLVAQRGVALRADPCNSRGGEFHVDGARRHARCRTGHTVRGPDRWCAARAPCACAADATHPEGARRTSALWGAHGRAAAAPYGSRRRCSTGVDRAGGADGTTFVVLAIAGGSAGCSQTSRYCPEQRRRSAVVSARRVRAHKMVPAAGQYTEQRVAFQPVELVAASVGLHRCRPAG